MEASLTAPMFVRACEDLIVQLNGDHERAAVVLRVRLIHLAEVFKEWERVRPDPGERADAVNQLIDLNRSTLIYFSKKTRPR